MDDNAVSDGSLPFSVLPLKGFILFIRDHLVIIVQELVAWLPYLFFIFFLSFCSCFDPVIRQ